MGGLSPGDTGSVRCWWHHVCSQTRKTQQWAVHPALTGRVFVSISNLKLQTTHFIPTHWSLSSVRTSFTKPLSQLGSNSDSLSSNDLPFKLPQVSQNVLHFLKPGSKHRTLHVLFRLSFLKSKTVPSSSFSERCEKASPVILQVVPGPRLTY